MEEVYCRDVLVIDAVGLEKGLDVFVEPGLVPPAHRVQLLRVLALVDKEATHDHA